MNWVEFLGDTSLEDDGLIWCQVSVIDLESFQHELETMTEVLKKEGILYKVIISGTGEHRYLDIMPVNAGKDMAMNWVSKKFNLDKQYMLCCGDSSNDLFMLESCEWGLLVSNAYTDAKNWYEAKGKYKKNFKLSDKNNAFAIIHELKEKFNLN